MWSMILLTGFAVTTLREFYPNGFTSIKVRSRISFGVHFLPRQCTTNCTVSNCKELIFSIGSKCVKVYRYTLLNHSIIVQSHSGSLTIYLFALGNQHSNGIHPALACSLLRAIKLAFLPYKTLNCRNSNQWLSTFVKQPLHYLRKLRHPKQ